MPQRNDNTMLFLAAAGVGIFFLMNKKKMRGEVYPGATQIVKPGSEEWANTPDAVIDTEKQKLSVPDAINMAKDVIDQAKDALVVIRTKKKNVALRSGAKKLHNTKGRRIKTYKHKTHLTKRQGRKIFSKKNTALFNFGL